MKARLTTTEVEVLAKGLESLIMSVPSTTPLMKLLRSVLKQSMNKLVILSNRLHFHDRPDAPFAFTDLELYAFMTLEELRLLALNDYWAMAILQKVINPDAYEQRKSNAKSLAKRSNKKRI